MDIGIRIATNEVRKFSFHTSRLGLKYAVVKTLFRTRIQHNSQFRLKLLQFFVDTGIRDCAYIGPNLPVSYTNISSFRKIAPALTATI
jgi:arginine decarboxylase